MQWYESVWFGVCMTDMLGGIALFISPYKAFIISVLFVVNMIGIGSWIYSRHNKEPKKTGWIDKALAEWEKIKISTYDGTLVGRFYDVTSPKIREHFGKNEEDKFHELYEALVLGGNGKDSKALENYLIRLKNVYPQKNVVDDREPERKTVEQILTENKKAQEEKTNFECVEEWLDGKISEWNAIDQALKRPAQGEDFINEIANDMRMVKDWINNVVRVFRQIFKDEIVKDILKSKDFDAWDSLTSHGSQKVLNALHELKNNLTNEMLSQNFDRRSLK